jgi:acyl-CoA hydrolase
MNTIKYRGILASSSDTSGQTLSSTVQGIVVVLSAIVPMLALQFFHVTISATDISTLVTEIGALIGVVLTIRGLILKVINSPIGTTTTTS